MRKMPIIYFGPKPRPRKKEPLDPKISKVDLQFTILAMDRILKSTKEKKK